MVVTNGHLRLWPVSSWRIGFKLTLFCLLLALIPLVLITFFVNTVSRNTLLSQGAFNLQSAVRSTVHQIDRELEDQRDNVAILGQMPEIVRYAQNPIDASARDSALKALKVAAGRSSDYESVAVLNNEGRVILSSSPSEVGTDFQLQAYFKESLKGANYISNPSVSGITNQPAIFYSAPIKNDGGSTVAVVLSRLNLNTIWSLVEQDADIAGPGSFGMLFDENGIRLADSSSKRDRQTFQDNLLFRAVAPLAPQVEKALAGELRFGRAMENGVQVVPLPQIAARLASGDTNVFTTRSEANNTLNQAAIIRLSNKPWSYVVSAPQATYTAAADSVTVFASITAIVLGVIALALAIVLSRSITRPLTHLAQVADRISLGELDAKIAVTGKDEVGELSEALVRMQASIRAAIERSHGQRVNV